MLPGACARGETAMGDYPARKTESSKLRERLDHPVIDTDGHLFESSFVFPDFLKKVGGAKMVERFDKAMAELRTPDTPKRVPWAMFCGKYTIDRATVMLPKLYSQRLAESGVDFSTIYPTVGFSVQTLRDDEVRQAGCRALNMMYADMFS